ncbi:MAG: hypothetical protein KGN76_14585 [Acidobacteriota bacterium]|nr:hypothetical protein [Acidobacteriota bacterium]
MGLTSREPPSASRSGARGLAFLELLVAMALSLIVAGAVALVLGPMRGLFETRIEANDMEQRLRAAGDALSADLLMAGAGAYAGARAGPLVDALPPVVPFPWAASGELATDAFSLVYVPATAAQTVLASPLAARSGTALVAREPGCPLGDPACGFSTGMHALVYDGTGRFDLFTVRGTGAGTLDLRHELTDTGDVYPAGAKIVAVVARTYRLDQSDSEGPRLVREELGGSREPVVDHVVGLHLDYEGAARPPELRAPGDAGGGWTTYGMKPPGAGVQEGSWPAGENCLFALDPGTGQPVPRGAFLAGADDDALVPLAPALFGDGPWCPEPGAAHRFDADLLRIRRVTVTLRVESAVAALRGAAGPLFARPGTATAGGARLPDREFRLVVAPRNLNLGR